LLGSFKGDDKILTLYQNGHYRLSNFDLANHFDEGLVLIEKWKPEQPIAAIYWDAGKERYFVKRFLLDDVEKKDLFISESAGSRLELVTTANKPVIEVLFKKVKGVEKETEQVDVEEFISVKGWKAQGNQLTAHPVKEINLIATEEEVEEPEIEENEADENVETEPQNGDSNDGNESGQAQITLDF